MIDYALGYAQRGWPVFVLSSSKVPVKNCGRCDPDAAGYIEHDREACECLTCHGFYAATTDAERLTEMARRHPRGCLGVRTGAESGLAVIDVDVETDHPSDPGLRSLAELDRQNLLPGTVMGITGSGGLHLLYGHPGGYLMSGAHKYGHKLDSKADGGYIVVPPSIHPRTGIAYRWSGDGRFDHPLTRLHEALCARLRPPDPVQRQTGAPSPFARPGGARGRLAGLLNIVLGATAGERNDKLHWAAKKAGEMVAGGELDQGDAVAALQSAGREIGLTENEIGHATTGTIGSGLRKGLVAA